MSRIYVRDLEETLAVREAKRDEFLRRAQRLHRIEQQLRADNPDDQRLPDICTQIDVLDEAADLESDAIAQLRRWLDEEDNQ